MSRPGIGRRLPSFLRWLCAAALVALAPFEARAQVSSMSAWDAADFRIWGYPTNRANFVSQLKTIMLGAAGTADDIKGFNFDWERPSNATEWGNYTQLARELRTAFEDPLTPTTNNWEVSVCDYGSTDSSWDNTAGR